MLIVIFFIFCRILNADCVLMKCLGNKIPFEAAVGMNGRVWVKARSNKETIAVANAILASEYMTNEEIKNMCQRLADALDGF